MAANKIDQLEINSTKYDIDLPPDAEVSIKSVNASSSIKVNGTDVLTAHQSIKTLDTTATSAQSASSDEAIAGTGKITLHKISKTGNYNDLLNKPTLGTAASKNTGTASGNVPVLDSNGKLADSVIPAVAITDTYEASSQDAMLKLGAQKGDICIRSDLNKSFVLQTTPASTLGNWKELKTPTDAVLSVNGKTGAVQLAASDVGALPSDTKYAASSSVGGVATSAAKLSNTAKIGDTNKPVYFTANGVPTAISYTIEKSVPSNAVFTDTKNTAGSTNSTSKLFLVGASTQAANPQTYSNSAVYTQNGKLYSNNTEVSVDGHTHSFDTITSRGEAFLSWGGKNFSGTYGPIDAAMVPELGANRLAFMPADAVTIEYSRDGGSTWTDYGPTDSQKVDLFNGRGSSFTIGKATSGAGNIATNKYQLRVNIYTSAGHVYTALNKFVIYLSTSGTNNNWCTIRARKQSDYTAGNDTWTTFADKISVSGWSGYNVINTSGITTYGNTASTQYGHIQFIFGCDTGSTNNSYPGLQINKIFGFGGVGWTTPSTMAKTGQIYTYDSSQNVTFPAGVSAKSFTENGKTLSATYIAKSLTSAKGDMIYASAANTPARLGIGSNGQFLSIADGIPKWVNNPNTDTHYTNYLQIKGNGTEAVKFEQNANKTLNLKPGNNVSISAATNEITISATVPTKSSWNYDDMYVKYTAAQSLTDAQKSQARANISAVSIDKDETISGLKTFAAPTNKSGTEQATVWFNTANGGRVGFGKEGANSGTGIFFDQVSGTRRLKFRASATPGAMVWEQPESGSCLYYDVDSVQFRKCNSILFNNFKSAGYLYTDSNGSLKKGTLSKVATSGSYNDLSNKPTIPTKSSWNYDDVYVKYNASQSLTDAQKSQARSNIGAGTSSLAIGTTASTAAAGNHTHSTTLSTDNGTPTVTMAANTTYKLSTGGTNVVFKTPSDAYKILESLRKGSEADTAVGYYKIATINHASWNFCDFCMLVKNSYAGTTYSTIFNCSCSDSNVTLKDFKLNIISGTNISNKLAYLYTYDSNNNLIKIEIFIHCTRFEHPICYIINTRPGQQLVIPTEDEFNKATPDKPDGTTMTGYATYAPVSGGTNGQLLSTNGSSLVWTDDNRGLLHHDLGKTIANTTTDSGWTMFNDTYDGFLLKSLRFQSQSPAWGVGDFGSGIVFGGADTKGVISLSWRLAQIKFAGGNSGNGGPVWWIGLTGTSGTSYDLDSLRNKQDRKVTGSWSVSTTNPGPMVDIILAHPDIKIYYKTYTSTTRKTDIANVIFYASHSEKQGIYSLTLRYMNSSGALTNIGAGTIYYEYFD